MTSDMKSTISAALQQEEILQKDPLVQHLEKNHPRAEMKATLRRKEKEKGKDNNAERISQMLNLIPIIIKKLARKDLIKTVQKSALDVEDVIGVKTASTSSQRKLQRAGSQILKSKPLWKRI